MQERGSTPAKIILVVIIASIAFVLLGCICLSVGAGGLYALSQRLELPAIQSPTLPIEATGASGLELLPTDTQIPSPVPTIVVPTSPIPSASPLPGLLPDPSSTPTLPAPDTTSPTYTLSILENITVPINDLADIAARLEGKTNIPPTLEPPLAPLQVGAKNTFWTLNSDNNKYYQAEAILRYVTDHAYFWIADNVSYRDRDLESLAQAFESEIYPTNREFFGSEWTPGVDGDPHLYVLYTGNVGAIGGYFSPGDEYNPLLSEHSNAHEMFILNADDYKLSNPYAYSTLAHEFQHMIHWYRDRNEESWINEGFSELAQLLNNFDLNGVDLVYAEDPDLQLTYWPPEPDAAHYGAAFLFLTYFLDRFGDTATQALIGNPANGMTSIDEVLAELGIMDPLNGNIITANDVFVDWTLTSYLLNGRIADGRYTYHNYPEAPAVSATQTYTNCPVNTSTRHVKQYGADYIRIRCNGNYTLHFDGDHQVKLLPSDAHSGSFAIWSNQGDESDMTLTQEFDFTNASGPLTLSYWTWYDLEKDYDYLYLLASLDGTNWQTITTPSGTAEDPVGNSYGWAYNGNSGGGPTARWIQENVDISQFAGKKVQLRFEYITDAAVNGEGFLLDDVSIPETGYATDFETDDGGWQADGFAHISNTLPQTFRVSLIRKGRETTVEYLTVSADNTLDLPLNLGEDTREVILVVSGTTPFTRQVATYRYSISP
jgi:immune inhibitor A